MELSEYSGYQPWIANFGGQTPCYSSLAAYITPAPIPVRSQTGSTTTSQIPTSAVVNIVYAMQYPVTESGASMSAAAKGGIGAGAAVAAIGIFAVLLLLFRRWRKRKESSSSIAAAPLQAPSHMPYSDNRHQSMAPTVSTFSYPQYPEQLSPGRQPQMQQYHEANAMPLGGFLPTEDHDEIPRPAYAHAPAAAYQAWRPIPNTNSGSFRPSPPTSTESPPPGSFGGRSSNGMGYSAVPMGALDNPELLPHERGYADGSNGADGIYPIQLDGQDLAPERHELLSGSGSNGTGAYPSQLQGKALAPERHELLGQGYVGEEGENGNFAQSYGGSSARGAGRDVMY
jgi:hypothetical protein